MKRVSVWERRRLRRLPNHKNKLLSFQTLYPLGLLPSFSNPQTPSTGPRYLQRPPPWESSPCSDASTHVNTFYFGVATCMVSTSSPFETQTLRTSNNKHTRTTHTHARTIQRSFFFLSLSLSFFLSFFFFLSLFFFLFLSFFLGFPF